VATEATSEVVGPCADGRTAGMRFSLLALFAVITVACLLLGLPSEAYVLAFFLMVIVLAGSVLGTIVTLPFWIASAIMKSRQRNQRPPELKSRHVTK
jgi:membrane protein YqaA with SNARE-associated domain